MKLSRTIAPLALSFGMIAGMTHAEDAAANDNTVTPATTDSEYAFSCDAPDYSGMSVSDVLENIYPANVLITDRAKMTMPFGIAPSNGEQPQGRAPGESLGSGFVVDPRGYIVTNAHVLGGNIDATEGLSYTVTFYSPDDLNHVGQEVEAELIGIDDQGKIDLAVLKVDMDQPLPCVSLADSSTVRIGDDALAIGNPFGLSFTFTRGYVSATMRNLNFNSRLMMPTQSENGKYHEYFQTDASINPGNSGGGLYNIDGEVIGVNTMIFSANKENNGIGFAIPSSIVAHTANKLILEGEIRRGWLGVSIQDINADTADKFAGVTEGRGVLITGIQENSPAFEGGLKKGDVVLSVNGQDVNSTITLARRAMEVEPGDIADLSVVRDGSVIDLPVEIGSKEVFLAAQKAAATGGTSPTGPR